MATKTADVIGALRTIEKFTEQNLTGRIADLEQAIRDCDGERALKQYHSRMADEDSELWQIGERIGPRETGEKKLRAGTWDQLVERVKLLSTPNGTYAVRSLTRCCVLRKSGNAGTPTQPGTIEVLEDGKPG